jgi:monoamine oxidase
MGMSTVLNLTSCRPSDRIPLLQMQVVGAKAAELEGMSNAEVADHATQVLRCMFGPDIPAPIACAVSRWCGDPHAYTSYAAGIAGVCTSTDRERLSSPVQLDGTLRVFFAGEHTHGNV